MTRFVVQFTLPVDNPVNKVSKRVGNGFVEFNVPVNHPDAHSMGYQDLLAAQELSGLFHLFPSSNNKSPKFKIKRDIKGCWQVAADATELTKTLDAKQGIS